MTSRHCSSDILIASPSRVTPALTTATSTGPKLVIVPPASALPAYGERVVVAADHGGVCTPADRDGPHYGAVRAVLDGVVWPPGGLGE